jgi:hypothetical protein
MFRQKPHSLQLVGVALVSAAFAIAAPLTSFAGQYDDEETTALLQVLNNSKVGLAEGVQQLNKGEEAAISAKFELGDDKKLSLSVYTAEKGLGADPEHNVLKEFSGSPEKAAWAPEAEIFKDIPHVARASGQLTLMALAKHSLANFIARAHKQHKGTVFSAIPEVQNHRPMLVVLIADEGKVSEVRYDLETGHVMAAK